MKHIIALLLLFTTALTATAQYGEIAGKVLDENGEGANKARVLLADSNGTPTGKQAMTDYDGNFSIKPLTPGKYNVLFTYAGHTDKLERGVVVNADKPTWINANMKPDPNATAPAVKGSYKKKKRN